MTNHKKKLPKSPADVDQEGRVWLSKDVADNTDELALDTPFELWISIGRGVIRVRSSSNISTDTISNIWNRISPRKLAIIIILIILGSLPYFFPEVGPVIEQLISTLR